MKRRGFFGAVTVAALAPTVAPAAELAHDPPVNLHVHIGETLRVHEPIVADRDNLWRLVDCEIIVHHNGPMVVVRGGSYTIDLCSFKNAPGFSSSAGFVFDETGGE